jgi:hypothetical protein
MVADPGGGVDQRGGMILRLVVSNPRPITGPPQTVQRVPHGISIELSAVGLLWPPDPHSFEPRELDALRRAADAAAAVIDGGPAVPVDVWDAWGIATGQARAVIEERQPDLWPAMPPGMGTDLTLPITWGLRRLFEVLPALGLPVAEQDRIEAASLQALQAHLAALATARQSRRPAARDRRTGRRLDELAALLRRHGGAGLILRAGQVCHSALAATGTRAGRHGSA